MRGTCVAVKLGEMRRAVLAAVVVLALATPAIASAGAALDQEIQTAVAAAVTRDANPDDLISRAGKPDDDYLFRALQGEVDIFVQKQDNGAVAAQLTRGEETKRRVVDLRAIEWRGKDCSCSAILLFKEKKFIYGVMPAAGSEDTAEKLAGRYADKPKVLDLAGPGVKARLYAYPDRGVGYVSTGPGTFAFKVIFPIGTKATDFRGAILGKPQAPAVGTGGNVRAPAVAAPRTTPPPAPKPAPRR